MIRAIALLVVLAACRGEDPAAQAPPPTPVKPAPILFDAALAADTGPSTEPPRPPDAAEPARPDLACLYWGPKEWISLATNRATMDGDLDRGTVGKAPARKIHYHAVPAGDGYDLVFDSYLPDDYKPLTQRPVRVPPREHLVKGKSVIAHVGVRAGARVMFVDRDLDLATGMMVAPQAGAYDCR